MTSDSSSLRHFAALAGTSMGLVAGLTWLWSAWGARGAGFAFAVIWSTMTWVAVFGKVVPLGLPAGYHPIRPWERSGRVYRWVGVPVAKALLRRGPMSVFNPDLHLPPERTARALGRLDSAMRQAETSHVWAALPALAWAGYAAARGWWDTATWSVLFNVAINGYPIMLQRYNRNRLSALIADIRAAAE